MKKLILIFLAIFSFGSMGHAVEEYGCGLMIEDYKSKSIRVLPLENFSMLNYSDKVEFNEFSVPAGTKVKGLMCFRSSIIPAENDYAAILAGYPIYIRNGDRLLLIDFGGKFRTWVLSGEKLSDKELESVTKMLNSYEDKIREKDKDILVKDNNGEIQKGREFLIKEEKVAAKYTINICKRAKWLLHDKDEYQLDGGNYSWYIYRPLNNEKAPPGICVYISPRGGPFANVDRWKDIMDKRNLIYIASRDSSNFVPAEYRLAFTLRAIDIVKEKYKVNKKRIYVCGDSGGGRISSMVAPLFPEIIKGAVYSIGCEFWDTIGPHYWPGFLSNEPDIKVGFLNIKKLKKNRFVFLTGDYDANMEETKVNYNAYLQNGIKNCTYIQVKDMGHSYPPLEYWQAAFAYLDGEDMKIAINKNEGIPN